MTASAIIGQPIPRYDSPQKVQGQTRYTGDLSFPGMLHARLATAYQAHARIVSIDTSAARAVPGVVDIVTGRDLQPNGPEPAERGRNMLARDKVIFYGQPVAAVLAINEEAAQEAASLIEVEYESLGANVDPLESMKPDAPAIRPKQQEVDEGDAGAHGSVSGGQELDVNRLPANVQSAVAFKRGDIERGFAEADVVLEHTYRTSTVHQGYIEPHATVAVPDPLGNLTLYTATQGQFLTRNQTASTLGIEQNRITLVPMEVGGGFGAKTFLLEPLVCALALRTNRPVKLVLSRLEEFLLATPAPGSVIDIKTGVKRDGTITAIKSRVIMDTGAYPNASPNLALTMIGGYYRCDNLDLEGYVVLTNKPGAGAYRAPGSVQGTYAIEQQIDAMARAIDWDPIEFRLKNCAVEGDPQPNGEPWPAIGKKQVLEALREHPLWQRRPAGPNEGIGVAVGGWLGGIEPCAANMRVNSDGSLTLALGSIDISGTNTSLRMIAAEAFGVPLEKVKLVTGNSDTAPYSGMAGGSKIIYTVGNAVKAAAEDARQQVLAIAAAEFEVAPEDLELVDGRVRVKGLPDRSMTIGQIAGLSMTFGSTYPPIYGQSRVAVQERSPGFSGQIAHVRVDPDTGEVELLEMAVVQDVGFAINPAMVEGQIVGGATQGIGWGLHEGMVYDTNGQPLNPNLMDYNLPKSIQAPPFDVRLVEVRSDYGPYGAKGVGEPPVVPTAPAIANAVADAIGTRVTELPITSQRVRDALNGAK